MLAPGGAGVVTDVRGMVDRAGYVCQLADMGRTSPRGRAQRPRVMKAENGSSV